MSYPTRPLTPTQTYSPIKSHVPEFYSTKKDVGIRASYQFQSTITQLLREDLVQQNDFSHVVEEKEKIATLARSLLLSHKALKEELEEQKRNMDLKDSFNENMKKEVAVFVNRNAQLEAEVEDLRNERDKLQQQCMEMKNYAIECESRVDTLIMEKKMRNEAEESELREHESKTKYEMSHKALEDEIHRIKTEHLIAVDKIHNERMEILREAQEDRHVFMEAKDELEQLFAALSSQNKEILNSNKLMKREVESLAYQLEESKREHDVTKRLYEHFINEVKKKQAKSETSKKYNELKQLKENQDKVLMERFKKIGELGNSKLQLEEQLQDCKTILRQLIESTNDKEKLETCSTNAKLLLNKTL